MSEFLKVGGDPQRSLEGVNVPSYAIDSSGVIRWVNPAGERLMGDVRGRHFTSMVAQETRVIRLLPLEIVEGVAEPGEGVAPLYDFEPSAEEVLDAILPRYIEARIHSVLLQAAASELANRQRAMNTAVSNAEDIIRQYTRLANSARQAEITQEISEIVSGADALAAAS